MAESISIDKNLSDVDIYNAIIPQIQYLLNNDEPIISNLSNVTAVLMEAFNKFSWVGFYLLKENKLYLGPFQGKAACTVINVGSGVCGASAQTKDTIIVDDVNSFPGHIACDSFSKSEIVVPLIQNDKLCGVLDIDSHKYASFNLHDKMYLEIICRIITEKLNFNQINEILK
ncbi:MAG: GAF sensor protein [Ignavibacteria bacterium]|nr:MAG: GAF sensor protein [Ignavibacteria bacterium]KAF0160551.1 MAG: GAF sensor protein [Ignavibacteria bacterium]